MKQQLMMLLLGTASVFCSCETQVEQHEKNELRAPAYPLVTIDPYTSAWSTTDNLYDSPVKHWTGKDFSLLGVAKVDGQTYRFMGTEELELRPLVRHPNKVAGQESIPLNNLLTDGRISDSMIKPGKKAKLPSEPWRMNIQLKPNGVKNLSGYAG